MRAGVDRLGERVLPHYGVLALAVLLASGARLLASIQLAGPGAASGLVVTILSPLVSSTADLSTPFLWCRGAFFVGGAVWLLQRMLPWSALGTALSFTAAVSLHQQRQTYVDHVFHLVAMQLWIYALWSVACAAEIGAARRTGSFWRTPLYPRWVFGLSVFHVGLFYSLSGLAKLLDAGLGWPNGISLQLWVRLWGRSDQALARGISASRGLARALQIVVLVAEVFALPLAVRRRLRALVGVLLIGFHIGQQLVFGWAFGGNLAVLALTYLPVSALVERWANRRRT